VPWFEGESLTDLAVESRRELAAELGTFLGQLHTDAPPDAPVNPVRGVPLADRQEVVRGRITGGSVDRVDEVLELWDRLWITEPWTQAPVWMHGDLHPGNILIRGTQLAAVIDFGDVTSGDPASDLAVAWLAFDREGRDAFYDALPAHYRADEALLLRTAAWGLALATVFTGFSDDNPRMAAIGSHALGELLDWDQSSGSTL
jgi:aminoglycoside phosphotransferase (APT) family kinase protein